MTLKGARFATCPMQR
jgi:hypothetical protein